jgi:hypothetical protein
MPVSEAAHDKDRDVLHATRRTAAGGSEKAAVLAWRGERARTGRQSRPAATPEATRNLRRVIVSMWAAASSPCGAWD